MSASRFLHLQDATIIRPGVGSLEQINFTIDADEQWAVIGEPEGVKTLFLQALAGQAALSRGSLHHDYAAAYLRETAVKEGYRSYRDLLAYVPFHHHFRNRSNLSQFYYQQRFNSSDAEEVATVRDYLNSIQARHGSLIWTVDAVMTLFGLHALEDEALIMLSNGETRRLMLAAALLRNPRLLLLENPLVGLDQPTRLHFEYILETIIRSGIHVVMTTTPTEIPECITHVAVLRGNRLLSSGPKHMVNLRDIQLAGGLLSADTANDIRQLIRSGRSQRPATVSPVVELRQVSVRYGERQILNHVSWTVEPGEAWCLQGRNGAGKSTLLSLINGDNPQAYRNEITLFGRRRGTGESIWDIKKQIGYISPELHQYFPKNQTLLQVVLSGYFDTVGLFRQVSPIQRETALKWLDIFGLGDSAQQRLATLSPDRQRLGLLARAIIKTPTLLILDEPCQGLSPSHRDFFKAVVDEIHAAGTTVIYVSHYEADIPSCVRKTIRLEQGRVVEIRP